MKYPELFSPIKVNHLVLNNRIVAAPITSSKMLPEYYNSKASMIIMGCISVDDPTAGYYGWDNQFKKSNRFKTRHNLNYYKQGGSIISAELMHMGRWSRGDNVVGPIDEINPEGTPVRGMTREDIDRIVDAFARTAVDAKEFGFDMVMLHFAHGWLAPQFLSPAWNKRTDEFGGCYENRAKFPLMIVKAVREAVGPNYPIDMRISVKEWVEGGICFEEVLRFIKDCEPFIDMVNLSAGTDMDKEGDVHMATTQLEGHMVNVEYSKIVKQNVDIPVAVVGSIFTPEEAASIIREEKADLVALGRALLADPDWIRKVMDDREEDIVPCIRCVYCLHWTTERRNYCCSVNPRYTRDEYVPYQLEKAEQEKTVVIIGGGPAGMKAAITAAQRGHKVTLYEKSSQLGGMTICSDYSPKKQDLKNYKDYLIRQVKKNNINLFLNKEATPDMVREINPDVIIVAIGARPITPRIKGVEYAMQAIDAFPVIESMPEDIVIVGGGTNGCELGLDLDNAGRKVSIIEVSNKLHKQDNLAYDIALDQHIKNARNLKVYLNTQCVEIQEDKVIVKDADGKESELPTQKVILATGLKSNTEIADKFFGITPETYVVGDCRNVSKVRYANETGFFTALNL